MFQYLLLNHEWIYLLILLLLCLVIYHYLHLAYYFKGNLCNASFMFDEFFCGGGWWLVDFTSTTFRFILLLVGGYLTRFLILRDRLWEVYFTFSFWVLDGELFTENYEIEVFKPDNWELIFEDSETTLSLSINDYWGRELFTHYVLNFHRSHLKIGIVIYLLLLLASIHLERFGVQQALYFRERLILLP